MTICFVTYNTLSRLFSYLWGIKPVIPSTQNPKSININRNAHCSSLSITPTIENQLETAISRVSTDLHFVSTTFSKADNNTRPSSLNMETRPLHRDLAATFQASLPTIELKDLPDNSQDCHICKEPFENPGPHTSDNIEVPVKLPCTHIMGSSCLAAWLENHKTCPMCRVVLFSRLDSASDEHLRNVQNSMRADVQAMEADMEALLALERESTELSAQLVRGTRGRRGSRGGRREESLLIERLADIDDELVAIEGRIGEARIRLERFEAEG